MKAELLYKNEWSGEKKVVEINVISDYSIECIMNELAENKLSISVHVEYCSNPLNFDVYDWEEIDGTYTMFKLVGVRKI